MQLVVLTDFAAKSAGGDAFFSHGGAGGICAQPAERADVCLISERKKDTESKSVCELDAECVQ